MNNKPALFIGSSSEGLEFARAIRTKLEDVTEVTLWEDNLFSIGNTLIDSLITLVKQFDFAILLLSKDDLINSRNTQTFSPRDNVIFELGLFMGTLGRARCFIIEEANANIKIPSDLGGLITAKYHWPRSDNNHIAAIGGACDSVRKVIINLGFNENRTQKKVDDIEIKQIEQKKDIDTLSFLVSNFIPKFEIEHLRKLLLDTPFLFNMHESFKREIRHLLDMQMICKIDHFSFAALPDNGNLKDFFAVTESGKNFLILIDNYNFG